MSNIQIFSNPQFGEVRIVTSASGEPVFCLADVCSVIGIANARNVKTRLEDDDVCQMDTVDALGRNQQVTFVTESGLYDVIIRSDSEKAKPFRKWVTSEVLPSIRKHGTYMTPGTLMQMMQNPDSLIQLLTVLKDEQEQNAMLRMQNEADALTIEAMKPKAEYFDTVLRSTSLIATDAIAAELGISAIKLNKFLCDMGIQRKVNGVYVLLGDIRGKGLEGYKTFTRTDQGTGEVKTMKHMYWTEKGAIFVMDLHRLNTSKLLN